MADELKLKIILDDGSVREGFLSVEKQAEATGKKVGKAFDKKDSGLNSFTDALEGASGGIDSMATSALRAIGPYGALAGAVAGAAAATFKMALAGEQVNAVNTQFAVIASSAGLAADQFKESIIGATQGLIDDEDALQIATKGIVALGTQASKLPAILDASRGVSRALGKDFKSTFEDLSTFVENGNARVLRQFGIVLDLDKAYANAAKSIGIAASALTEQQKQQVRANLILEEVPKKFGAAAESVTPLRDAFDRLKVSASNSLESIQSQLANFITSTFVDKLDLSNVATSRLNSSLADNKKRLEDVNVQIEKLTGLDRLSVSQSERLNKLLIDRIALQDDVAKSQVESSGRSDRDLFAALDASRASDLAPKEKIVATPEQTALARQEQLKRLNDLQSFISAQDKLILDSETKRVEKITNSDEKLTALKALSDQQSILLEQQKNATLAQVEEQFSLTKGFSTQQKEQALLAAKQNYYLQEQALAQANADKIKEIEDNKNFSLSNSFQTFSDGFSSAATDFRNNAVKNFQEVGKQAFNTIGRGVGQAFASFGQALAKGEDAGKAFLDSTLKLFGELAVNLGTYFIALGAAKLFATPKEQAEALPLISAGAALAVLGGLLGASGSSSAKSSESGGGIAASPSSVTDNQPEQNLTRQEPGTAVSVVIQGDVLDSDESGSRIVNLINSAFDKKGVVITQGAFA